jgi:1-deoxy-D-xylulose-5-phosphate reductoisomerase
VSRRIVVLGSTGSIGESALDLVGRGGWEVEALTGGRNVARLAEQARTHRAALAVTAHDDALPALREALAGSDVVAAAGARALEEAAARPADVILNGIVGAAGLAPSLAALRAGRTLALANKETLVAAGTLVMATARRHGAAVIPVDSEHSAVFQALQGEDIGSVERVVITASGGAFRDWPVERLARATVADASSHPNWDMGQRITIDSASMFNKALELIETREYFGVEPSRIEVLVHPESLVHALVGFRDGALMAHLGPPDMRHAIGYALAWPNRERLPVARLDLAAVGALTFRAPDERRWPALRLAREVMAAGGHAGAVFNAAKEAALDAFIAGEIGFPAMAEVVERTLGALAAHDAVRSPPGGLEGVMEVDHLARRTARALVREGSHAWT